MQVLWITYYFKVTNLQKLNAPTGWQRGQMGKGVTSTMTLIA